MVSGKKFPYTKAGKVAAKNARKGNDLGVPPEFQERNQGDRKRAYPIKGDPYVPVPPGKPKPPRDEVYGKRIRDVMSQGTIRNVIKKTQPRVAPKPERRPFDERRAVRRRG